MVFADTGDTQTLLPKHSATLSLTLSTLMNAARRSAPSIEAPALFLLLNRQEKGGWLTDNGEKAQPGIVTAQTVPAWPSWGQFTDFVYKQDLVVAVRWRSNCASVTAVTVQRSFPMACDNTFPVQREADVTGRAVYRRPCPNCSVWPICLVVGFWQSTVTLI